MSLDTADKLARQQYKRKLKAQRRIFIARGENRGWEILQNRPELTPTWQFIVGGKFQPVTRV